MAMNFASPDARVEGGVYDAGGHEDAVAGAQGPLLLLDPMIERARHYINEFCLVGVVVEAVPLTREEGPFDHGEVLGTRRGRIAQPAEPRNLQLIPLHVVPEYELAGYGHLRLAQS